VVYGSVELKYLKLQEVNSRNRKLIVENLRNLTLKVEDNALVERYIWFLSTVNNQALQQEVAYWTELNGQNKSMCDGLENSECLGRLEPLVESGRLGKTQSFASYAETFACNATIITGNGKRISLKLC
jgi:hypothetical protein